MCILFPIGDVSCTTTVRLNQISGETHWLSAQIRTYKHGIASNPRSSRTRCSQGNGKNLVDVGAQGPRIDICSRKTVSLAAGEASSILGRNICSLLLPKQTCLCSFARNSFFLSFLHCRHCGISNCLDSIWNVGQENDRGRNYFVKKFFLRILLAFYDSRRFKRVYTLWNIYYRCFQLWNYPRTRNYGNHNYGLNYPIKISERNRLNKQNWITNYLFNIQIQMVQKQSLEILICNSNINYFYRANFQRNEHHAW